MNYELLSPPAEGAAGHATMGDDLHALGDILAACATVAFFRTFLQFLAADRTEGDVGFEI